MSCGVAICFCAMSQPMLTIVADHALRDEAGRVADHGDGHAVGGKKRMACIARGTRGRGRGHQRAALRADERKERVDRDDAARVERFVHGGRGLRRGRTA